MHYCRELIDQNVGRNDELYTSDVIKKMLEAGHSFRCQPVGNKDFYSLRTPEHIH